MFQYTTNFHNHSHWACILVLIQRHLHLCLQHCWSKTIQHRKLEKNPQAIEIEVDLIPLFKRFFAPPKGNWKRAMNPNIPNLIVRFNPSISPRAPRWIWLAGCTGGQPGATSWIKSKSLGKKHTCNACDPSTHHISTVSVYKYIYIHTVNCECSISISVNLTHFHPMFLKYPSPSSKETLQICVRHPYIVPTSEYLK